MSSQNFSTKAFKLSRLLNSSSTIIDLSITNWGLFLHEWLLLCLWVDHLDIDHRKPRVAAHDYSGSQVVLVSVGCPWTAYLIHFSRVFFVPQPDRLHHPQF